MTTITISEDEYMRLKEKAGETVRRDPSACIANGHTWKFFGGTNAGCHEACSCSVPVHECIVCGENDYGENDEAVGVRENCEEREELEYFDEVENDATLPIDPIVQQAVGQLDRGL